MAKKKSNYILKALVALPNYDRKDLKLGMSVQLEEEVGDKFAKRGFLVKASEAVSKGDKELEALKKENADLVKANEALSKELEALKKAK